MSLNVIHWTVHEYMFNRYCLLTYITLRRFTVGDQVFMCCLLELGQYCQGLIDGLIFSSLEPELDHSFCHVLSTFLFIKVPKSYVTDFFITFE